MSQKIISSIIILISLITIIKCDFPIVRCDEKSEVPNVCGLTKKESVTVFNDQYIFDVLHLKKNCKDDEICEISKEGSPFLICKKKIKLQNEGHSCGSNLDCKGSRCSGSSCETLSSGQICTNHFTCEPGFFCRKSGEDSRCFPIIAEDENCHEDDICEPGTICNYPFTNSEGNIEGKCINIGWLEDGEETNDAIYCKSGIQYEGKCVTIIRDGDCINNGDVYTCHPDLSVDFDTVNLECSSIDGENFCPISLLKIDLFNKYINKFRKINSERFIKKKNHRVEQNNAFYLDDGDTYRAFIKYFYYGELRAAQIMDELGDIDKECEFKYILSINYGNFIKVNRIMTVLFGILIFFL